MDPRHPGWRRLILAFNKATVEQPQYDEIIVDMVNAYPGKDRATLSILHKGSFLV